MLRCHQCGKILHELPFRCRRCGQIFCVDHHLPENHHCSWHHHHHDDNANQKYCGKCGRKIIGNPYKCHRCGVVFCDHCWLPENHGCAVTPKKTASSPPPNKNTTLNYDWKKIREQTTLKNFTSISIIFIIIGLIPFIYSLNYYTDFFKDFFQIGIFCFILAYFLYAIKYWGATSKVCALLMVSIPMFAYYFATSKIPESTTNIFLYLFIQFCLYAIISVVVLYISGKVISGIESFFFRQTHGYSRYFCPHVLYAFIGVIVVSFFVVNLGSAIIVSENVTTAINSFQKSNSPSYTATSLLVTTYQDIQVLPTIQPDIVNNIEKTVGNAAPTIEIPTLELRIHELINQQRTNHRLSSLSFDSSLASIARKHSTDMAKNNYFAHVNLQGLDPTDRGNLVGYSCYKNYGTYYTTGIAENIMQNNLYDSVTYYNGIPRYDWNSQEAIAQSTVTGWMNSPGHRQNILTSTYYREGIGVAMSSDNKVYVTEDFC